MRCGALKDLELGTRDFLQPLALPVCDDLMTWGPQRCAGKPGLPLKSLVPPAVKELDSHSRVELLTPLPSHSLHIYKEALADFLMIVTHLCPQIDGSVEGAGAAAVGG